MSLHTGFLSAMQRSDHRLLLAWSELTDPMLVGLMARAGFDAVLLDMQHGLHDVGSVRDCISEAALAETPVLVRVEVGGYATAARVLDMGAVGVVAPMINDADDARRFVHEVKYPPLGARSWGPGRAMQLQRQENPQAFLSGANEATLALAMIETRQALDNLQSILAVPGLDGVLVGPGDLSIALSGGQLDPDGSAVREAMGVVLQAAQAAVKLACAYGGSVSRTRELFEQGYRMVSPGYDSQFITAAFEQAVNAARQP